MKKEEYNKKLGDALQHFRLKKGYTQEEASNKLKKSRTWLADKEHGRGDIYFGLLNEICNLYEITPNDIAEYIKK